MNYLLKNRVILFLAFIGCIQTAIAQPFVHPGILHTEADFLQMQQKVKEGAQPWEGSFQNLISTPEAQLNWTPHATATVIRGGTGDNVSLMYRDVAAAYQHALIWKITGNKAHGDKAVEILNAWSATNTTLTGNADRYLASGLFGYQFANAAEIMRDYPGFNLKRFQNYMLNVFYYPLVERFLLGNQYGADHNDACITNYWANWDLCNMAAMAAIGVLCDNREIYNKGIEYFKHGAGNGSIEHAVPFVYSDTLAQWQESGRDQGHTLLGIGLMSSFCEIAWNQGDDLFSYDDNRFRKAAEYAAKYNLGDDVPFTKYTWGSGQNCAYNEQTVISSAGRGEIRPIWELIYNHYAVRASQSDLIPNIAAFAESMRPDGGPGGHATTYDQPGFGSLTHSIDPTSYFYPWQSFDIGNVGLTGGGSKEGDTITVKASGKGIEGSADQFHFVFQRLIGNGEISARVLSTESDNEQAIAGVMIRESLDTMSAKAFLCLTPSHILSFGGSNKTSERTTQITSEGTISTPFWIKLVRKDSTFIGYQSANGENWVKVDSMNIDMSEREYVGLAVANGNNDAMCTAQFDSIQIRQGNVKPTVIITNPIDGSDKYVAKADIPIDVYADDSDGSVSRVEFYVDSTKLGEDTIAPFSYLWKSVDAGNYTIEVKGYDNDGQMASSNDIHVKVNSPTERLPWYKFDGSSIAIASDDSGNGLSGFLYGGINRVSSPRSKAISLDGINDYVFLPRGVVELLNSFTITTWVKLEASQTWSRIFDFGTGTDNYMFLSPKSNTGNARFVIKPLGLTEQQINADQPLPVGKWVHVAVTLSGDTGVIYLDGEKLASSTGITFKPYDLGFTDHNYIGRSQWSTDPYLEAQIDEFQIFNHALTAEEIKALLSPSTGVEQIDADEKDLLFYPNPATSTLRVINRQGSIFMLYSLDGKLHLQKKITSNNQIIDISSLKSGIYFMKVSNIANVSVKKLVVE